MAMTLKKQHHRGYPDTSPERHSGEDTTGQAASLRPPSATTPPGRTKTCKRTCVAWGPLQDLVRSSQRYRGSRSFSLSWLFRSGYLRSGQLPCPGILPPDCKATAIYKPGSASLQYSQSTRCLVDVRHPQAPGSLANDLASAALRRNDQGRPRVAARRPPIVGLPRAALPGRVAVVADFKPGEILG